MGKAARLKREKRKYSLLEPGVESALEKVKQIGSIKRGSVHFEEFNSEEFFKHKSEVRFNTFHKFKDSVVDYSQYTVQTDLNWMYVFGDVVPTFIEDKRLYDLFSSTKVPKMDLRNIIRQLPHVKMSFPEFHRQFDSSFSNLIELKDIENGTLKVKHPERYNIKYLAKNVSVHILSGCLFVPREANKYCISFYSRWFEDEKEGGFYFDDVEFRDGSHMEAGCFNDVFFVSTAISEPNGHLADIVCGMNHHTISEIVNDVKKFEKAAQIGNDPATWNSAKVQKVHETYRFVVNFIYYLNTYPNLCTPGLPEHDIFNNGANKLEVAEGLDFDLISRAKSGLVSGTGNGTKCPHYRSGYYRVLKSEFFKNKRFETVYIAPVFVHKDIFVRGEDSFKTIESNPN